MWLAIWMFQYFNCIGGINFVIEGLDNTYGFQYFNCIGGIPLEVLYKLLSYRFNTSTVSVEFYY